MQLWTYHSPGFPVDTIAAIDHTKSYWWTYEEPGFRYREVLPILWSKVSTKHFLWCIGLHGTRIPDKDEVEWEVNLPQSAVLTFYRTTVWDDIVWSRSNNWPDLLIPVWAESLSRAVGALVSVPLPPGSAINKGLVPHRRHGLA